MRLALALLAGTAAAEPAPPVAAAFAAPTDRYPHGILGAIPPWGAMEVALADGTQLRAVLAEALVFEDMAPRLWDLSGDGVPEVVVVESDAARGSRLAVWAAEEGPTLRRVAASAFIGTRFRWLAPLGAADLDSDGRIEVAWVEAPHRDRILRVARLEGDALVVVASLPGVTNHLIGEETISGGLRA